MNLLKAVLYDPAVAVTKNTTAGLAMTALDTVNLRAAVTVPAHGMLRVRMACCIHGAATAPQILLGAMNGAAIIGRVAPVLTASNLAATTLYQAEADFIMTGLAPGAMNIDAAYAVETLVAATGIKYGGPNDATVNNAFGAFALEVWDPQPLQVSSVALQIDANGRVDVGKVLGTAQTAGDLKASLNTLQADTDDIQTRLPAALVGGRMDSSVGAMAANVLTAAAINADAITAAKIADGAIDAATFAANAVNAAALAADAVAEIADGVWDELTAGHVAVGSTGLALITAGIAGIDAAGVRAAVGLAAANLDVQLAALDTDILTRLATASYTVPPTTGAIADKLLGRNLAGAVDGTRTVADALRALRNKTSLAAGVLTVYQEDDATPAWTAAVTQAARDPITAVDPA